MRFFEFSSCHDVSHFVARFRTRTLPRDVSFLPAYRCRGIKNKFATQHRRSGAKNVDVMKSNSKCCQCNLSNRLPRNTRSISKRYTGTQFLQFPIKEAYNLEFRSARKKRNEYIPSLLADLFPITRTTTNIRVQRPCKKSRSNERNEKKKWIRGGHQFQVVYSISRATESRFSISGRRFSARREQVTAR